MNFELLHQAIEQAGTAEAPRNQRHRLRTLRGVRGIPLSSLAKIIADAWKNEPPSLPQDEDQLSELFSKAFEDGLVAIGLLAALAPDAPGEVLDIARDWWSRVDDTTTADALGWMVLGPAALASKADLGALLSQWRAAGRPEQRRAGVITGMAMTPTLLEGPSAAGLRARLGFPDVAFVAQPLQEPLIQLCNTFLRDEDPVVRKGLRRVLGAWAACDPDGALDWLNNFPGGVPKLIRQEAEKSARKAYQKNIFEE